MSDNRILYSLFGKFRIGLGQILTLLDLSNYVCTNINSLIHLYAVNVYTYAVFIGCNIHVQSLYHTRSFGKIQIAGKDWNPKHVFRVSMRWCWKQEHSNHRLLFSSQVHGSNIVGLKSWDLCQVQLVHWPRHIGDILYVPRCNASSKQRLPCLKSATSVIEQMNKYTLHVFFPSSYVHHHLIAPKHNSFAWLYCNSDSIKPFIDDLMTQYSCSSTSSSCTMAVQKLIGMKTLLLLFVLAAGDQHLVLKPKEKHVICCLQRVLATGADTLRSWNLSN